MSQNANPQGGPGFNPQGGPGFNPQGGPGFNPQGGYYNSRPRPDIQSPLLWSILSMIFCCVPFGIVSVVYAAQVNSMLSVGAYQDAANMAAKAKKWAWISFGCGLVYILFCIAAVIITAAIENGAFD